jgi:hypothetical protein
VVKVGSSGPSDVDIRKFYFFAEFLKERVPSPSLLKLFTVFSDMQFTYLINLWLSWFIVKAINLFLDLAAKLRLQSPECGKKWSVLVETPCIINLLLGGPAMNLSGTFFW